MSNWEEWCAYCKELAVYYVRKYNPTKLEMLEWASINRRYDGVCGGQENAWMHWRPVLPHEFRDKQIEKLCSFKMDMQSAMYEIYEWVLTFVFSEFGGVKDLIHCFVWDSLFWLLNLEYYKRKQRTIFQDYQTPSFDWDALEFWLAEGYQMIQNRETKVLGILI